MLKQNLFIVIINNFLILMHFNIVPKQVLSNLLSVMAVNRKSALGRKVCDAFLPMTKKIIRLGIVFV